MLYKYSDDELERHLSFEGNYQPVFTGNVLEKIREVRDLLDYTNTEHRHISVRLDYINIEYGRLLEELSDIKEYLE